MLRDLRWFAAGIVSGLLAAGVVVALRHSDPATIAPLAPELRSAHTDRLECQPVVVYRDAKVRVGIPASAATDPTQHLTTATKLPASSNPATVSAVFDETTGETSIYVRRDPLPWLDFTRRAEIGIDYGYTPSGITTRLSAATDLVNIKSLRFGATGNIAQDGNYFVGVSARVLW